MDVFSRMLRQFEADNAKYAILKKQFEEKMLQGFISVIFEYCQQLKNVQLKNLRDLCDEPIKDIWEEFNYASCAQYKNAEVTISPIFKIQTREEAEIELQKDLKEFSHDRYREKYKEIFWENFEGSKKHSQFEHSIHKKIKEIFTEVFFDDVMTLEPVYLRYFDSCLYYQSIWFVQSVYKLELKS